MTVRATEDIPFERVRLAKTTQEQKTQMDVASALAAGDKAAVGTRYALDLVVACPQSVHSLSRDCRSIAQDAAPQRNAFVGAFCRCQRACS